LYQFSDYKIDFPISNLDAIKIHENLFVLV